MAWNRCEGWFPEDYAGDRSCNSPSRTSGSKHCNTCYNRKRRYTNPEEFRLKRREYYAKNPEQFRSYESCRYWRNRDAALTNSALYYLKNADRICAAKKEKRRLAKLAAETRNDITEVKRGCADGEAGYNDD